MDWWGSCMNSQEPLIELKTHLGAIYSSAPIQNKVSFQIRQFWVNRFVDLVLVCSEPVWVRSWFSACLLWLKIMKKLGSWLNSFWFVWNPSRNPPMSLSVGFSFTPFWLQSSSWMNVQLCMIPGVSLVPMISSYHLPWISFVLKTRS